MPFAPFMIPHFVISFPTHGILSCMKILALSDRVEPIVYSSQIRQHYGDVDMVIGCGDLPYYYLEFVTTMLKPQTLYVYGNHDKVQYTSDGQILCAPEGCISLEGRVILWEGLLLAGLGGSMRYQPLAIHQYTEPEMRRRILKLIPRLILNKVRHGRYLDILVTHSPPFGIHDGKDLAHTGFKCFLGFMERFKPKYLLHGHKHAYRRDVTQQTQYGETTVINVYPKQVIEF